MVEAARRIASKEFMREISTTFDKNVIFSEEEALGESTGIPLELLESKGRFLGAVVAASMVVGGSDIYERLVQGNDQLLLENRVLRQKIQAIEERLASIEASIPKEKVVVLRELTHEEAEREILELFSKGQTLYYSDIAERLGLDLKLVVEICNELQSRGEIQVVDDVLQGR